jgi:hypothetical protein
MSEAAKSNSRRAPRQRVLKTVKIYRMNGSHAMDTTVRDLSETGARIVCKDQLALPNELKFVLPGDGFMHIGRVVWRRGELAGIQFLSERGEIPRMQMQNGSHI